MRANRKKEKSQRLEWQRYLVRASEVKKVSSKNFTAIPMAVVRELSYNKKGVKKNNSDCEKLSGVFY